ncbi:MAG: hypothetical protein Q7W05_08425 [Deltaproteobacteria bacterium]|nr:hypothetical protein [Deltaproteobacteria bacterium]
MKSILLLKELYDIFSPENRLRAGFAIAVLLILGLLYSSAHDQIAKLSSKRAAREVDISEMMQLKLRYHELSGAGQKLANRLASVRPDDSPAKLIDEIGIKGKSSQIKPLKGEERPGYLEDVAEVRLEGLSANETMNLLFRLEKGNRPVVIKKTLIKTRFDDPSKLDLTLVMALLKPAPQGSR